MVACTPRLCVVALSDDAYVRRQYLTTGNLDARAAVWTSSDYAQSPQDVVLDILRRRHVRDVLEVGCGKGALARRLGDELKCSISAIDSSTAMVSASQSLGVDASVGDVRHLAFERETFDAVVAAWMLYHVDPLSVALTEISRVLRPAGRVVAVTNGRGHLAALWSLVEETREEASFSRENGESLLRVHFANVERIDVPTKALFANREAAARYLQSVGRADLTRRLPSGGWPLSVDGASTVFTADKGP